MMEIPRNIVYEKGALPSEGRGDGLFGALAPLECFLFFIAKSQRNEARIYLFVADTMKINIDKLTESELIELNQKIVERLRFLNQARAHVAMLEFKIGDQVSFVKNDGVEMTGMLTKYNKKTVTVITHDGQYWNISPSFLSKAHKNPKKEDKSNVVVFPMLSKASP